MFIVPSEIRGAGWTDTYWSVNSATASVLTGEPIPGSISGFTAMSDYVSTLTFSWNQPANWHTGCYYRLWRGTEVICSSTTNRYFDYTPPSPTTSYTYYVAAYNSKGEKGPSSSWTGKVSGGGGGGPMDSSPEQQLLQLEPPQRKRALPPFLLLSLLVGGLVAVVSSLSQARKNLYFRRSKEISIHGRDRS